MGDGSAYDTRAVDMEGFVIANRTEEVITIPGQSSPVLIIEFNGYDVLDKRDDFDRQYVVRLERDARSHGGFELSASSTESRALSVAVAVLQGLSTELLAHWMRGR